MFEQLPHTFVQRELKTSEPRFTRLSRTHLHQSKVKDTNSQNFPTLNRGYALDNSKQNLYYETHLTKVRSACKLDEVTIVSKYLGSIRKNFDDMSKASRNELNSVKLKKREIQFMKRKNQVYFQSRAELEGKIAAKEAETNEIRAKEDDAKMQTKILENIITRMKKDQIFYKQYGRIKDEELKQKAKDLKLLDQNLIREEQNLHKLSCSLESCRSHYNKNREAREKKYEDYADKIGEVRERDQFIQERKERTYKLQSIELNDTLDQKNIHMREIILAHRVADSMLQSKVSTLIKKYSDIQGAFHLVKIKTGVSQPQLLTSKFFSYEQTAQSLLESIAQNQSYIQSLIQKKEKLAAEYRSLNQEKLSISQKQIGLNKTFEGSIKDRILQQANRSQLLADQIVNWTHRHLKQFKPEEYPKDASLSEKFKILCNSVVHHMKKYQNVDLKQKKVQILGVRLKKVVKQPNAQQLSIRLRQTEDMNQSNLIQQEFIQTSRQNVTKKKFNIKHVKRESAN